MSSAEFLVELGTEELPPKSLQNLSQAFEQQLVDLLKDANVNFETSQRFAAPRRLAVSISGLALSQPDESFERKGPAIQAAFDKDGKPSKAAEGFARSCGTTVDSLEQLETDKGSWLVFRGTKKGQLTSELMPGLVQKALDKLPIAKRMRWGSSKDEFVRPVQWLVLLLNDQILPGRIYGVESGNQSKGHRFHAPNSITLSQPKDYAQTLKEQGKVLVDFEERKSLIRQQAIQAAELKGLTAVINEDLLDEVTALNEWPVALVGRFDDRFLDVPQEALVSSMEEHQKYFHTVNADQKIQPYFVFIANIESKDPNQVIEGNEKVIRPRLADAAFFWETDKKTPLADRVEKLGSILFQKELGTLADKTTRIQAIATNVAEHIGADIDHVSRAGLLAKTDLLTDMVFEFTDLQGIAGSYYALHEGEPYEVAQAIKEQYLPAGSGDDLPETKTGICLALADRLDNLTGLFGIGQPPSGTKDPFALRRAAIGVLRILIEKNLDLDLQSLIAHAMNQHQFTEQQAAKATQEVINYLLDRFDAWYSDDRIAPEVIHSVRANQITRPVDFDRRVRAVHRFVDHDACASLASANKRVSNILTKNADQVPNTGVDVSLLVEAQEKALATALESAQKSVQPLFDQADYQGALSQLANLKEVVDPFFDHVMVMADDEAVRRNRLALLNQLRNLFLQVADISLLSV